MKKTIVLMTITYLMLMCFTLKGNEFKTVSYPVLFNKKNAICYSLINNGNPLLEIIRESETNNIFFIDPLKNSMYFFSVKNNIIQLQNSMIFFDLYDNNYMLIEPSFCFFSCFIKTDSIKSFFNIKSKFEIQKGKDSFFLYHLKYNKKMQKNDNVFKNILICWGKYDNEYYVEIKYTTYGFLSIAMNISYHAIFRIMIFEYLKNSKMHKIMTPCSNVGAVYR